MNAGLRGEGAGAHEGRMAVRLPVEDLVHLPRDMGELAQGVVRDAEIEAGRIGVLQLQRADERNEIGIAAALAEAVEGALDMTRARLHGRKGIRNRAAAI